MSEVKKYSNRRQIRMMWVMMVYKFELLDHKISTEQLFEIDEVMDLFYCKKNNNFHELMKVLKIIEKNYDNFKKMISNFIRQDWTWKRISPIIRSILLCASAELWNLDIGIVSNEYTDITKDFIPETTEYRFVNSLIEKIGKKYNEHKKKSN